VIRRLEEAPTVAATATPAAIDPSPFTVRRTRATTVVDPCEVTDPAEAADLAGLRYVTDQTPGIARLRAGRHFRYRMPDGAPVRDERVLARIKALAIPPAWTDVWICPRPDGHLQATGRDDRGRKQYRYHPRWREVRDESKYGRMLAFGRALPAIRERVAQDIARPGLAHDKVTSAVVRLLERTLIRVGNEEYARSNESFGLTTLRDDHVDLDGAEVRFVFRGKSGKEHEVDLRDRKLSGIVRKCRDLPGQVLFQYLDEAGEPRAIGSADVNAYLRAVAGEEFTAKDFRTWHGTVLAARALIDAGPCDSETERTHQVVRAVNAVAERLGNTPAICRRCYVHPTVLEAYHDGRLAAAAANAPEDGSADEALVLALLDESGNNH
jgi:DNA topoisomerase-1